MSSLVRSLVFVLGAAALLAGCEADNQELQAWMDQQRREVKPSVQALAAPKKFDPVPYVSATAVDPFSTQKLSVAIKQESKQVNPLFAAEQNRRKDPLESFPLDSMAMVGSLVRKGTPVALLRVDNLLYQVKPGDYLGQNFGKIMRISETEVTLRWRAAEVGSQRGCGLRLEADGVIGEDGVAAIVGLALGHVASDAVSGAMGLLVAGLADGVERRRCLMRVMAGAAPQPAGRLLLAAAAGGGPPAFLNRLGKYPRRHDTEKRQPSPARKRSRRR